MTYGGELGGSSQGICQYWKNLENAAILMIQVHRIDVGNVAALEALYGRFSSQAQSHYGWADSSIPFDALQQAFTQDLIAGYYLTSGHGSHEPVGLMLYRHEVYRAIEINVIYLENLGYKTAIDRLIPVFIRDILPRDDWDVVSYALLGEQGDYVLTLPWYGFTPVGQTIYKFDFLDALSVQVMKKQSIPPLPANYRILPWKPQYGQATAANIYEAFHTAADALWDPRFKTLEGCRDVVALLESGLMGTLYPGLTSIATREGEPVGFCFVLATGAVTANIPLIGIHPSEKGLGLGSHLLQHSLNRMIQSALIGTSNLFSIDATTDTQNFPALQMYRRMGFKEQENYPHLYLTRAKAEAYKPGQWC